MSHKKGERAKKADKGNPDTLLGNPVYNIATCIEKAKEKGQKDKIYDFQCDHHCYSQHRDPMIGSLSNTGTHDYHYITQNIQDLSDSTQQNNLHSIEENASSFTDDANTLCDFSIADHNSDTKNTNDTHMHFMPKHPGIH